MKTLISLETSVGIQDTIIESYVRPIYNENKQIEWVNEKDGICKHKRYCKNIILYFEDDNGIMKISISPNSLLNLAKEIKELNSEIIEDILE